MPSLPVGATADRRPHTLADTSISSSVGGVHPPIASGGPVSPVAETMKSSIASPGVHAAFTGPNYSPDATPSPPPAPHHEQQPKTEWDASPSVQIPGGNPKGRSLVSIYVHMAQVHCLSAHLRTACSPLLLGRPLLSRPRAPRTHRALQFHHPALRRSRCKRRLLLRDMMIASRIPQRSLLRRHHWRHRRAMGFPRLSLNRPGSAQHQRECLRHGDNDLIQFREQQVGKPK